MKPYLCNFADAYILVPGNITVEGGDANTNAAFKNCHPFTKGKIHLNDTHVDESDNLDFIMNMYNLIEYSDNYSILLLLCINLKDKNSSSIMGGSNTVCKKYFPLPFNPLTNAPPPCSIPTKRKQSIINFT